MDGDWRSISTFHIKNEHPDEEVDQEKFRYPGPNPFTKEQAVLMMADSVEAASRSLPEYTEESISTLVDKIIDNTGIWRVFQRMPYYVQGYSNS